MSETKPSAITDGFIPLITAQTQREFTGARRQGVPTFQCSLDLGRSVSAVELADESWIWQGIAYPYPTQCKERTIYYWDGAAFKPVARFTDSLIKLVPTEWGPPTFEIDGIKMLPTAKVSPYDDARDKVKLIAPHGKVVLDTCGGLGYFAAWCLTGGASRIQSFEKNADVIWLRSLNPWSPKDTGALSLTHGDSSELIAAVPTGSVDAVLHDPPRFGIAGELYSQTFYDQLARVLKRGGRLFHYTGTPNKLTTGRDVPHEVSKRLQLAGFTTQLQGDGVLATKKRA